eukprot:CAMPEP_0171009062 /NCGR_PEP_ID=MMETSP0736-20130129/21054_1 /TAXON_ID=186038 /ORGANISM="Fragilariopsis kerguelensis, Strain L26-C5" /LENGTH=40 /DNA_ID= /DNA_START= /DNA_END= /DNA_ORIENTATION=
MSGHYTTPSLSCGGDYVFEEDVGVGDFDRGRRRRDRGGLG